MPTTSALARLQRSLLAGLVVAALLLLAVLWRHSPVLAMFAALVVLLVHAPVLALEILLMVGASRTDPSPKPTWLQLARSWAREVVDDAVVFGWRQPFRWRTQPDWLPPASAGRTGIVFVHGFVCNRGFWLPWLRRARQQGIPFAAVNLEPVFGDIDDFAATLDEAVLRITHCTGRPPVIVCHSMGGLVARAWLRAHASQARVSRIVTIASPHRGTWIARFSRFGPGRQMRQDGPWLSELGCDEPTARLFTCWYSNCDNIVFPPRSATLDGADNRFLAGCAHVDLAFRREVMDATFALVAP